MVNKELIPHPPDIRCWREGAFKYGDFVSSQC